MAVETVVVGVVWTGVVSATADVEGCRWSELETPARLEPTLLSQMRSIAAENKCSIIITNILNKESLMLFTIISSSITLNFWCGETRPHASEMRERMNLDTGHRANSIGAKRPTGRPVITGDDVTGSVTCHV